jgi:hypothetical protein
MTEPTRLEDMSEAEQAGILLAHIHDRPLQWWSGKWFDRSLGLPDAPQKGRAYRLKPSPKAEAEPTTLKDISEKEQLEVLLAWLHGVPLQYWDNWQWTDRENTERPPLRNVAYRLKPEPKSGVGYVNVYPKGMFFHQSRSAAASSASVGRLACIRVDWTEGQFDE